MKIEKLRATNFTSGRSGYKLDRIVIHHWGQRGQTTDGIINWFCRNSSCNTSCHYIVGQGRVVNIVKETDTAWHAGNWSWNCRSIGIECMPEKYNEDLHLVAKLVADIWRRYGKLPIYEHRDIVSTDCCGIWSKEEVRKLAEKYYNGNTEAEKEDTSSTTKNKGIYVINKDTSLWDVSAGTWAGVKSVKKFKKGDRIEIADFFTSKFGSKYGRTHYSKNRGLLVGFNVADLDVVSVKKSVTEIAREVINGKWGNGEERKIRLEKVGYSYNKVQAKVNEFLG